MAETHPTDYAFSNRHVLTTDRVSQHRLTPLELLPAEILTDIFYLADCNVCLPRSSHYIGIKLFPTPALKERVLNSIPISFSCRRLGDTDYYNAGQGFVEVPQIRSSIPSLSMFTRPVTRESLKRERSELLRSRWITWDVLDGFKGPLLEEEKQRFESSEAHRKLQWHNFGAGFKSVVRLWLDCHFPRKLLTWPISDTDKEFLDFLDAGGCTVDSLDRDVANDTLLNAIAQRDYRLIHRFLGMGISAKPDKRDIEAVMDTIQWDWLVVALIVFCVSPRNRGRDDAYAGFWCFVVKRAGVQYPPRMWPPLKLAEAWGGYPCHGLLANHCPCGAAVVETAEWHDRKLIADCCRDMDDMRRDMDGMSDSDDMGHYMSDSDD